VELQCPGGGSYLDCNGEQAKASLSLYNGCYTLPKWFIYLYYSREYCAKNNSRQVLWQPMIALGSTTRPCVHENFQTVVN